MKIFLGFSEVANIVSNYKKGFEKLGHDTFTVVFSKNKYYPNAEYDVVLSDSIISGTIFPALLNKMLSSLIIRTKTFFFFIRALLTCEIFYYNTGGHILPFALDYKLIKIFNKKLVIIFLGSEIRHWYLYQKELEGLGYANLYEQCIKTYKEQSFGSYLDKARRVNLAEKYSNLILSQPGFAQLQRLPYLRATPGLLLEEYTFNIPERAVPIIVHAPSSRGVKGTEFVIAALEKLRREGIEFEFRLIENLPNHELLELLSKVDIVIDELNSDTIGVLSSEAMATGNAVISSYIIELAKVPVPCPVINSNKFSIYEDVKQLILDIPLRVSLANEGKDYVNRHHDIQKNINRELSFLNSKTLKSFDFTPANDQLRGVPEDIMEEERAERRSNLAEKFREYFKVKGN
tara:strand:- start:21477 stop:22688 length:1212 start_codon:yes stop_codon:yes gene_type:complete